ncbi:2-phosphosulfolactate phosphatase [Myxosarcina sp. GI1(2024)]
MNFDQADFEVGCEWGKQGVLQLAPVSDVVIIVDVLSFSTCVDIANTSGAIIYPYQWRDGTAKIFAESVNAELADKRGGSSRYSLSPASLITIDKKIRLVLPSPNGSSLSLAAKTTLTLTGCLRNCRAVALAAMSYGRQIAVVPAGEKWSDGSLRPSFEDWMGAGAIINYLNGSMSPEAQAAAKVYQNFQHSLKYLIKQCGSGKELIELGFEEDVRLATELNVSNCVPTLVNRAYINLAS